MLVFTHC